jgi:hypothetical protein
MPRWRSYNSQQDDVYRLTALAYLFHVRYDGFGKFGTIQRYQNLLQHGVPPIPSSDRRLAAELG